MGEFCSVKDEILDLKEFTTQNLHDECSCLENAVSDMSSKIVNLETKCNSLEQYDRMNNFEISGISYIPDSVE